MHAIMPPLLSIRNQNHKFGFTEISELVHVLRYHVVCIVPLVDRLHYINIHVLTKVYSYEIALRINYLCIMTRFNVGSMSTYSSPRVDKSKHVTLHTLLCYIRTQIIIIIRTCIQ